MSFMLTFFDAYIFYSHNSFPRPTYYAIVKNFKILLYSRAKNSKVSQAFFQKPCVSVCFIMGTCGLSVTTF